MNSIKKIILLFFIFSGILLAAPVHKVIMCKTVPKTYTQDVYKKTIVIMTEARLYLQKKYKKKITFEYTDTLLTKKDDILKELEKKDGRFYVSLDINKKKSKKNLEKVLYNLKIFDKNTKRLKTVKTKAIIRDKKIVKISQGAMKSSAKKIAKILKKK